MKVKHRLPILMAIHGIKNFEELSKKTNLHKSQLLRFNNYKSKFLDPEVMAKICELFQCKIDDLLYLDDGRAS